MIKSPPNSTHKKLSQTKKSLIAIFMVVAVLIGGAFAFLTASDTKENVFTVGNVDIVLNEDGWVLNDNGKYTRTDGTNINITPGSIIDKAPTVTNTGKNPAYIYAIVSVPTRSNAEFMDNAVQLDGELDINVSAYAIQEGYEDAATATETWEKFFTSEKRAEVFGAAKNDTSALFNLMNISEDWTPIEVYKSTDCDYYIFALNEKLDKDATTAPMFTNVQLISAIGGNSEFIPDNPYKDIKVIGYCPCCYEYNNSISVNHNGIAECLYCHSPTDYRNFTATHPYANIPYSGWCIDSGCDHKVSGKTNNNGYWHCDNCDNYYPYSIARPRDNSNFAYQYVSGYCPTCYRHYDNYYTDNAGGFYCTNPSCGRYIYCKDLTATDGGARQLTGNENYWCLNCRQKLPQNSDSCIVSGEGIVRCSYCGRAGYLNDRNQFADTNPNIIKIAGKLCRYCNYQFPDDTADIEADTYFTCPNCSCNSYISYNTTAFKNDIHGFESVNGTHLACGSSISGTADSNGKIYCNSCNADIHVTDIYPFDINRTEYIGPHDGKEAYYCSNCGTEAEGYWWGSDSNRYFSCNSCYQSGLLDEAFTHINYKEQFGDGVPNGAYCPNCNCSIYGRPYEHINAEGNVTCPNCGQVSALSELRIPLYMSGIEDYDGKCCPSGHQSWCLYLRGGNIYCSECDATYNVDDLWSRLNEETDGNKFCPYCYTYYYYLFKDKDGVVHCDDCNKTMNYSELREGISADYEDKCCPNCGAEYDCLLKATGEEVLCRDCHKTCTYSELNQLTSDYEDKYCPICRENGEIFQLTPNGEIFCPSCRQKLQENNLYNNRYSFATVFGYCPNPECVTNGSRTKYKPTDDKHCDADGNYICDNCKNSYSVEEYYYCQPEDNDVGSPVEGYCPTCGAALSQSYHQSSYVAGTYCSRCNNSIYCNHAKTWEDVYGYNYEKDKYDGLPSHAAETSAALNADTFFMYTLDVENTWSSPIKLRATLYDADATDPQYVASSGKYNIPAVLFTEDYQALCDELSKDGVTFTPVKIKNGIIGQVTSEARELLLSHAQNNSLNDIDTCIYMRGFSYEIGTNFMDKYRFFSVPDCYFDNIDVLARTIRINSDGDFADNLFKHNSNIRNVIIGPDVTAIPDYAFSDSYNLESVTFENIEESKLVSIGAHAFEETDIHFDELELPQSLEFLGEQALFSGELDERSGTMHITKNLTQIGDGAFYCQNIELDPENTAFVLENGILYTADKTRIVATDGSVSGNIIIPNSVTEISSIAFAMCDLNSVDLSNTSITTLSPYVFCLNLNLTSILYPETLTKIDYAALACTGFETINIPDSVRFIGESAFEECENCMTINIGSGVEEIQEDALYTCSYPTVNYNGTVAEWNAIELAEQYVLPRGTTINCTDGTATYFYNNK